MVTFVETRRFTRIVADYLDEDEYAQLQRWLVLHPRSGSVIPGSGGIRKLRWGVHARGKRGGLRVIYYLRINETEIWMLTVYAKNEADDITLDVLRRIREEIDG
jgi:mRNA-degrading endonuclease RelE of RelBE toxin-antitoxin system